uniref:Uncharacterized protein n=1 Tax=Ananas comosus var. bracteatus TaxID=296719 RepID=A0A6V7PE79_ANACO|nr:unnamed protein product [Ananas comosus var. bracteatus]
MAEDAGREKESKQGGFKTMPFILANEVCDRFATTGFNANMITYLTEQLHLPLVEASNTLTNLGGTASLTPIVGALIADSFAGRFWTITVGSLVYQLGMLSLTVSAVVPALRPRSPSAPPSPSTSSSSTPPSSSPPSAPAASAPASSLSAPTSSTSMQNLRPQIKTTLNLQPRGLLDGTSSTCTSSGWGRRCCWR